MRIAQKPLLMNTGGTLPTAYEQLQYIGSSGTQWINTGVIPTMYTEIELGITSITSGFFYGCQKAWQDSMYSGLYNYNANRLYCSINSYQSYDTTNYYAPFVFRQINGQFFVDQMRILNRNDNFVGTDLPLYLFAINNNGVSSKATVSFSYVKIKENDVLIRDYVPAKRKSDNEIGLYDTVTARFYENQGTGLFTGA